MDIKNGFVGTVGNTPLIRLNSFSEETGCNILAKQNSSTLVVQSKTVQRYILLKMPKKKVYSNQVELSLKVLRVTLVLD